MASVVQDEMPCPEPSGVIRFVPFRESDLLPKTCSNSKAPSNNTFALDLRATWEIESMERNAAEIQP
ncbi:unnamed protein product [Clonostachys chloroleuca]|uniref:Uncharacterized protein n=1 Tax=Clonostachys chloroleuca TaxID=1926264 RepID=A0AA35QA71_9HYPO|nr:unnamed protein product [Clonostachys chloroleuca]